MFDDWDGRCVGLLFGYVVGSLNIGCLLVSLIGRLLAHYRFAKTLLLHATFVDACFAQQDAA